jgi:hypothetical protein
MVDEEPDPLELLNERKVKEKVDLGEKQGATEKTGEKATSKVSCVTSLRCFHSLTSF